MPLLVSVTKSATGGSQDDSQSVVEYAELVGKDNFKMARKDDRIWTKSLLFIYAKICVNVKCHLNHALFMVWFFLFGKKRKEAECWLDVLLWLILIPTGKGAKWRARTPEQAPAQAQPGVGTLPDSTCLVWSEQVRKGIACHFMQLEIMPMPLLE